MSPGTGVGNKGPAGGVEAGVTITLYGADWCSDCRRSRAWLDEHGVAYDYVDLAARPEAVDVVLERNDGLKRIPVIVFDDGTHLTEPSDEALAAKVAQLDGSAAEPASGPTFEVVDVPGPEGEGDRGRYELRRDGVTVGLADYRRRNGSVIIPHVETFPQHRGQGYAARLVDGALDRIRAAGERVVPLCPFAADHIAQNPRHHDLLA